jgi:hypothetical protein
MINPSKHHFIKLDKFIESESINKMINLINPQINKPN